MAQIGDFLHSTDRGADAAAVWKKATLNRGSAIGSME